jgi:hypothetical protein
MEISNNPEQNNNLMTLTPTFDSRAIMQEKGYLNEVKKLDLRAHELGHKLKDFENPVTANDVFKCMQVASRIGDLKLFELAEVRESYATESTILIDLRHHFEYERDVHRNAAVQLRDRALNEKKIGLLAESEEDFKNAKECFERYSSMVQEDNKQNLKVSDYKEGFKKGDESVEVVEQFFPQKVVDAHKGWISLWSEIFDGKISIPGVSRGWLRVYSEVSPREEDYPQAHEANRNFDEYVAKKYSVSVEDIHRYDKFYLKEFLGGFNK